MKICLTVSLLMLMLLSITASAQTDDYETIAIYLTTPRKAIDRSKRSFADFDQAVRIRDFSSLDWRLDDLKKECKNLNAVVYAMEKLYEDKWYLPKAKTFAKTFYDIVFFRLDDIVKGMKDLGKTEYLLNKYAVVKKDLEVAFTEYIWAEKQLLAKLLYTGQAEGFCISSLKIAKYATSSSLGSINLGPIEGEKNMFKVSYVPEGAVNGYLYLDTAGQTVVRYIMHRGEGVRAAYSSFNNLLYTLMACDHEEMEITDNVIDVKEVSAETGEYPVFRGRPKDYSILYSIEVGMKDTVIEGESVWEVYIEYSTINTK